MTLSGREPAGVILYGPPASGKDTITDALHALDQRVRLFERVKVGGGRQAGYRMKSPQEVEGMRRAGTVLWENSRYGATYVVDRPTLFEALADHVPVLHLGQVEAITTIMEATPGTNWTVVQLWCSQETAQARIAKRGTGDDDSRLRAWTETVPLPDGLWTLDLDTDELTPAQAAYVIMRAVFDTGDR